VKIPNHPVLAKFVMDHKMTGIRKAPDYVRSLKGLWPIRAREGKGRREFITSSVPRNSVVQKRKAAIFSETTEKTYFSAVYGNPGDCNFILINLLSVTECPNCLISLFQAPHLWIISI
jgi:hypothetical protein